MLIIGIRKNCSIMLRKILICIKQKWIRHLDITNFMAYLFAV